MPQKMYPQWQQAWDSRADEIDQHIVDCCSKPNQKLGDVTSKIGTKLNNYLQQEGANDPNLANNAEFQQKVQERIDALQRSGRIKPEFTPSRTA